MLGKIAATVFVLYLLSVLRRLREQRFEAEYQERLLGSSNNLSKLTKTRSSTSLLKHRTKKLRSEYAAVSVRFTPNACDKVRSLAGQRFLSKDAPLMPLQNCPRRNICNCFYEYHQDRRENDERSDFNISFGILPNYEEDENKHRRWYDHEVKKVS